MLTSLKYCFHVIQTYLWMSKQKNKTYEREKKRLLFLRDRYFTFTSQNLPLPISVERMT